MIAAVLVVLALQDGAPPAREASVATRITPALPAVGEPIELELELRTARGARVRFPTLPDTGTRIEPLDPLAIRADTTADGVVHLARYRLIAWDTGFVSVNIPAVLLSDLSGTRALPVTVTPLRVRSVLPTDTTARTPRPLREPADLPRARWPWWVALLAALVGASWLWRRVRSREASIPLVPRAAARARDAFAHAATLSLLDAGEPGRHALVHLTVLRRFLADCHPALSAGLTTRQLTEQLRAVALPIPAARLTALLSEGESLAYARASLTREEGERIASACRVMVDALAAGWRTPTQ